MKKLLSMVIAASFTVGIAAPAAMAADKVMKCGIVTNKDRSLSKGLVEFGKILEKETGGSIKVQVFTDGVLGGDRQTLEGLQMGTIHCTSVSKLTRRAPVSISLMPACSVVTVGLPYRCS